MKSVDNFEELKAFCLKAIETAPIYKNVAQDANKNVRPLDKARGYVVDVNDYFPELNIRRAMVRVIENCHEHNIHQNEYTGFKRYHIPLITNPEAEIYMDGKIHHFEEGYMYFFDHTKPHSAKSVEKRIHLLLDVDD